LSKSENVVPIQGRLPDDAPEDQQEQQRGKPTQAEILVKQVQEQVNQAVVDLFHTPEQVAYITFPVGTHRETHRLRSKPFKLYLRRLFWQRRGSPPSNQALQDTIDDLEGAALFDGPERPVFVRLAAHGDGIYLDLGNSDWEVVEITPRGWLVIDDPPVRFRRPRGLAPLPRPEQGGKLDDLKRFLNVTDDDWPLVKGFLVAMFRPGRPFPVLNLLGPQGSGKTTDAKVLRKLVDPNSVPLRRTQRDERDLAIAASNSHVIGLDNLSYLPDWLSDAICTIATEGGFATRELYSDDAEVLFNFIRPVILTGIGELAIRGDLLDRSILVYLPAIPESDRQDEETFWLPFEQARPQLLGAVLNAVSTALRRLPQVQLNKLPRMADFTRWVVAASPDLGKDADRFLDLYARNRDQAHDIAVEANPVASAVIRFMAKRERWEGTATTLLDELEGGEFVSDQTMRRKTWPKAPNALSNALRQLEPNLVSAGITVMMDRSSKKRSIKLERVRDSSSRPSSPSHTRPEQGEPDDGRRSSSAPGPSSSSSSSKTSAGLGQRRRRDGDDGDDGRARTGPMRRRRRTQ
jgi:hypothetical protein